MPPPSLAALGTALGQVSGWCWAELQPDAQPGPTWPGDLDFKALGAVELGPKEVCCWPWSRRSWPGLSGGCPGLRVADGDRRGHVQLGGSWETPDAPRMRHLLYRRFHSKLESSPLQALSCVCCAQLPAALGGQLGLGVPAQTPRSQQWLWHLPAWLLLLPARPVGQPGVRAGPRPAPAQPELPSLSCPRHTGSRTPSLAWGCSGRRGHGWGSTPSPAGAEHSTASPAGGGACGAPG